MFAVNFLDNARSANVLEGEAVLLRHPALHDFEQWVALREKSRDFLQPWEPRWERDALSRLAYKDRIKRYQRDIREGYALPWFIFSQKSDALLGGITLGHIKRGVAQSAQIGYWMGIPHAGKGYMNQALNLVVNHAFTRCGLNRLEAACIPDNERSIRLLEKAGFEKEGILRSYLKINGHWRDHVLYARINPTMV